LNVFCLASLKKILLLEFPSVTYLGMWRE